MRAGEEERAGIILDQGHQDLRLRVAETRVVLEHARAARAEHEPDVKQPAERRALLRHAGERRQANLGFDARAQRGVERRRGERSHAARVRAVIAVDQPLEVARGKEAADARAVGQEEQRGLLSREELFDEERPPRRAEDAVLEAQPGERSRLAFARRDHHALAGGQAVGLEHAGVAEGRRRRERGVSELTTRNGAVAMPCRAMNSLANALLLSSRAAACVGPNAAMPSADSASTRPSASGASGPTTTRSAASACASATCARTSLVPAAWQRATRAMPGLPGAAWTSWPKEAQRHASACSRAPEPTTRMRMSGV